MDLPKRKQARLRGYDYSSQGAYYITICTKEKAEILSSIRRGDPCGRPLVDLTPLGKIAERAFQRIEDLYGVAIDCHVIMPDHIHFILFLNTGGRATARVAPTVGRVVGAYKSIIANEWQKVCDSENREMGVIWQRNYYEHVIRNEDDLNETRRYIEGNPDKAKCPNNGERI